MIMVTSLLITPSANRIAVEEWVRNNRSK